MISLVDTHMRLGKSREEAEAAARAQLRPLVRPSAPQHLYGGDRYGDRHEFVGDVPMTSVKECEDMSAFARLRLQTDQHDIRISQGEAEVRFCFVQRDRHWSLWMRRAWSLGSATGQGGLSY